MIETKHFISNDEADIIEFIEPIIYAIEIKTGKEIHTQFNGIDITDGRIFYKIRFTTDHKFFSDSYSLSSIHDIGEKEGLKKYLEYLFLE